MQYTVVHIRPHVLFHVVQFLYRYARCICLVADTSVAAATTSQVTGFGYHNQHTRHTRTAAATYALNLICLTSAMLHVISLPEA